MPKIFKLGEDIRAIVDTACPNTNNRGLYQAYGQEVRKTLGPDAWNYICNHKIMAAQVHHTDLFPIIADGRQTNECEYWRLKGFLVVGINTAKDIREARLVKRDRVCDKSRMLHDTELQAQFVVTQMADIQICNNSDIEYLNFMAETISDMVLAESERGF